MNSKDFIKILENIRAKILAGEDRQKIIDNINAEILHIEVESNEVSEYIDDLVQDLK